MNMVPESASQPATRRLKGTAVPMPTPSAGPKLRATNVNFFYGSFQALYDISLDMHANRITALIGPSGCGKSTFLRSLNRINDTIRNSHLEGQVLLDNESVSELDVTSLRRRVGMVFQRPNPFPKSIFDNIAYGLRINGMASRGEMRDKVEHSLKRAALWDEVKDKLHRPGTALSGGQQQRLCVARAIAVEPEVLLMDEPTSAIDPVATSHIEELILELKKRYTIVIVTHNMQQAARISDYTAFFYKGSIIEFGPSTELFTNPKQKQKEQYAAKARRARQGEQRNGDQGEAENETDFLAFIVKQRADG